VRLAVASVTKMATVLGAPRTPVSKVLMAYTNHGKAPLAERNSGQKPNLSEGDHHSFKRVMSKNHSTAAKVTAELNIHLEEPRSAKTVR